MATQAQLHEADSQDIRIAVVLNGGVSLAIWIGGVVAELNRLVQASRALDDSQINDAYAGLLHLLQARARIDVIAGTSAGGLNGGFLSLGLVHGCDLDSMRKLWANEGALEQLLRDPRTKDAPSLLRGEYFHDALARAYKDIALSQTGRSAPDGDFVELYLTGTLWNGRRSPFTDEMGRRIVEVNHDATFQFSSDPEVIANAPAGDLGDVTRVVTQLAVASRCTSSFPGAFEPWWVDVDEPFGDRWQSTAGLANFDESQYVVDGGVLLNKPIRPALGAVYRQSASWQVRRLMAYVVPDPGEDPTETGVQAPGQPEADRPITLHAAEVVLGVMTRLRATGSVAAELGEIERHNEQVRGRIATRNRLAASLADVDVPALAAAAYPAYREVRKDSDARTIAAWLVRDSKEREWSERELKTELLELAVTPEGSQFIPPPSLDEALSATPEAWSWGQSELEQLGDLVVDVLKRAIWLAPLESEIRVDIVKQRERVHSLLADIRRDSAGLIAFWTNLGSTLPPRGTQDVAKPEKLAQLRTSLTSTQVGEDDGNGGASTTAFYAKALALAECLFESRGSLRAVCQLGESSVDPGAEERGQLTALVRVLIGSASDTPEVLRSMLQLHVVFIAFAGASGQVEQEVELAQMSSATPQWLTGLQEHHFGAFYRASWRVNDWMRGRIDGANQLVQMLLSPNRLRQLGMSSSTAYVALRQVAVGPPSGPHAEELGSAWDKQAAALSAELLVLDGTDPLPRSFPLVSARIAERLHAAILPDELRALADAVRSEHDPLRESMVWATHATRTLGKELVTLADIRSLVGSSVLIGNQRIRAEAARTDTFARTISHGFASLTSMFGLKRPRLVGATLSAIRGYALLVWVLVNGLTERSKFGVNMVTLALGVGGALLGLALVVPGVPILVPLLGAGLVLGATSATALTQRSKFGRVGWWLLVPVALVVVALIVWVSANTDQKDFRETLVDGLARGLVVVVIVLVGWFVARVAPGEGETEGHDEVDNAEEDEDAGLTEPESAP